jgi:hypothetical protein
MFGITHVYTADPTRINSAVIQRATRYPPRNLRVQQHTLPPPRLDIALYNRGADAWPPCCIIPTLRMSEQAGRSVSARANETGTSPEARVGLRQRRSFPSPADPIRCRRHGVPARDERDRAGASIPLIDLLVDEQRRKELATYVTVVIRTVQRTADVQGGLLYDMQVCHRGPDVPVTHDLLQGADVAAAA